MNIRMQSVLCSNPFMAFAMAGTFLASDGLLYYIFWELSLIPFIALIWGNGDVEERKKSCSEIFYLHSWDLYLC
jgi:NADH:ubiquinone oxidoreductase subunit 4 (subunit M)